MNAKKLRRVLTLKSGRADIDSHPAHGQRSARWDEIETVLAARRCGVRADRQIVPVRGIWPGLPDAVEDVVRSVAASRQVDRNLRTCRVDVWRKS